MFYNAENLFDTKDDKDKSDEEFLPESVRHWTFKRYKDKLDKLARVIVHSSTEQLPDLVGLCEVENDSCMTGLVRHSLLKEGGYRYVMTHSPDERGIDVALMYQRASFKLIETNSIRVPHEEMGERPTRDILHVTGKIVSGDTIDVFVVHKPSRAGIGQSRDYRNKVSLLLAENIVLLTGKRSFPHVIVMGDFNDYPEDESLTMLYPYDLHNLTKGKRPGTYKYKGSWGIFDQILVSGSLLSKDSSVRTSRDKCHILTHPFLLEEDEQYGGEKPFRTYNGMKYQGGYSDHLPVALDMDIYERE